MVSFNQIPSNLRVPIVTAEFDASQAQQGSALLAYRGLLIGQKTSSGSAAANSLHRVTSAAQVIPLAGRGSLLHRQAIAWFASNRSTELWILGLEDAGAGVAATGKIAVSGPATAPGTIALYLGGVRIPVGVASGDSDADIAEAITDAINAAADLPVTATQGEGGSDHEVTITFRHKGEVGNSFDIRYNFLDGDALPAGVGLTITAMASGATNPTLTSAISALGDMWFHIWSHPYTDSTSLGAIEAELASRNGPMRMIDGLAITSAAGSFSTLTTLGGARNSQHSTIVAQPGKNPLTPPWEFAAEAAALIALHAAADPAKPLQTVAMSHAVAPAEQDLWTLEERNLLLFDGIATTVASPGGGVALERMITTYQTSPSGADDTAYLDVTSPLTLMYLRFSFRSRMQRKYPRHKLADDGVRVDSGQEVMTPKLGKAEALGWFVEMEGLGLVEGFDQFKRDLVVARNGPDRNRLDFLLPPDLINQLMVVAAKIQFRL